MRRLKRSGVRRKSISVKTPEHKRGQHSTPFSSTRVAHMQHRTLAGNMKNALLPQSASVHPAREEPVLVFGSPLPVMRDYPFDHFSSVDLYELLDVLDGLLGLGQLCMCALQFPLSIVVLEDLLLSRHDPTVMATISTQIHPSIGPNPQQRIHMAVYVAGSIDDPQASIAEEVYGVG